MLRRWDKAYKEGLAIVILIAIVLVSMLGFIRYAIDTFPASVWVGLFVGLVMAVPVLIFELPFMAYSEFDTAKTSYWVCFFGPFSLIPFVLFVMYAPKAVSAIGFIISFIGVLIMFFLFNIVLHHRRILRQY